MFSLDEKVMDKSGKIFNIESIEEMDFGCGSEPYFVLKPSFDYGLNKGYLAYIPVSKSDNLLKKIVSREEALALIDAFISLEPYPEVSPRERKNFYAKVISSGNRTDILRVIKSLLKYKEDREKIHKPFSEFDKKLLQSLTSMIDNEFSLALSISPDEVSRFVSNRISR